MVGRLQTFPRLTTKVMAKKCETVTIVAASRFLAMTVTFVLQVGEGSFGEVFLLPTDTDSDPPVVKIGKDTTIFT